MSKQPDSENNSLPATSRRRGQPKSIKRRVIRLVLIPSVVALVLWLVAASYLVFTGFYAREVASGVRQVSIPAVTGLGSIQQERRLSVTYLAQPSKSLQDLIDQRRQTDQRLSALRGAAASTLANAPESIATRWEQLSDYLDQLPEIRSTVDSRSANRQSVQEFYDRLLDSATNLFDTQARIVPDVVASQGGLAGLAVFRASDLMSRAGSIIAGAFGSRTLSRSEYLQFVGLVGAYHSELANIAPNLRPDVKKRYEDIAAGDSWKNLVAAENTLIADGPWQSGIPHELAVTASRWETLTSQVSDDLIGLTIAQADEVSADTLAGGNTQLLTASLGSAVALAIAIVAILWAVRQSQVLVDRALSVRLRGLVTDARMVVEQQLPTMMERLRRGEKVGEEVTLLDRDYGVDEIGQAARVLDGSLQVAVGAVLNEVKQREAGMAMLMGVARRPQRPLQRGTRIVEDLQNRIGDEKLLAEMFDLHHQLNQTRRFLENLIILTGGQPPRRWRNPVPVRRVLQHAIAETQQYQRIKLHSTPDVAVVATEVAGASHLLAELLDNALTFSSPGSHVRVECSTVEHGVVVEIEDAGVGMVPADLARWNDLVATAPTPDVTALKGGAQLGLWVVAALAKRGDIRVTFRSSAYGGLMAIVLLPNRAMIPLHDATAKVADTPSEPPRTPMPNARPAVGAQRTTTPAVGGDVRNGQRPAPARPIADTPPETTWFREPSQPTHHPHGGGSRPTDIAGGTMGDDQPTNSGSDPFLSRAGGANPPDPRPPTRPPLAVRNPQEHLAPELRDDGAADDSAWETTVPTRTPDEAGARLAQYQRGLRAGRETGTDDSPAENDQDRKA